MPQTDLFAKTPFADAMRALSVQCVDVGARAGIEPDLLPIAFAVDAVGFEPEADAFARLDVTAGGPWRSLRHLPTAISGRAGSRTLRVTVDPQSSSLLPALDSAVCAHAHRVWAEVRTTACVETETLDGALTRFGLAAPDYIKLDVEGAEGEILAAAPDTLAAAVAAKVEVSFMPLRDGQWPAHEIDRIMAEAGFGLFELIRPARWRMRAGPVHPQLGAGEVPYARGRLAHGDHLYFREPDTLRDHGARALKCAWIAMAYGYFDHAAALMAMPAAAGLLARHMDGEVDSALNRASTRYGRRAWLAALAAQVGGLRPFVRGALAAARP